MRLHIATADQIADKLTKLLPKGELLVFLEKLGLTDVTLPGRGGHG